MKLRELGILVVSLLFAPAAHARDGAQRRPGDPPSLLDRVGIAPLERALRAGTALERERALVRLGELGSTRALELVIRALDANGSAQSPRERLIAVRALGAHVRDAAVRECLVRVMTGVSAHSERAEPLQALLRDTAALALAQGDAAALEALGRALKQSGRVAQAAADALVAHPPTDLSVLARAHQAPTAELVQALEELGDERAFELLRDIVRRAPNELRGRAAVALTRLGNFETVALAERWLEPEAPSELALAGLEITLLAGAPVADAAGRRLLLDSNSRGPALALLSAAPRADLDRLLLFGLTVAERDERAALFSALAQSGTARALDALARAAHDDADGADAAAYALALAPAGAADGVLARLLGEQRSRRRAARAASLRAARLGSPLPELPRVLEELLRSPTASDRSVAAFGLALLDPARAQNLLAARDPIVVEAAARAAPFVGAAVAAARLLTTLPAGDSREQLALALTDEAARAEVPTHILLELFQAHGAAAPLAALALGARDAPELRARLLDALAAPDAMIRAQTALGLSESRQASALGLLENAYRFEVEPTVRRAIVRAVARRPEAVKRRLLALAARLDPDRAVRELAKLGLAGIEPVLFTRGRGSLWVSTQGARTQAAASVCLAGGLCVPLLADPEGVLALAYLPAGPVTLGLALPREESNARIQKPVTEHASVEPRH